MYILKLKLYFVNDGKQIYQLPVKSPGMKAESNTKLQQVAAQHSVLKRRENFLYIKDHGLTRLIRDIHPNTCKNKQKYIIIHDFKKSFDFFQILLINILKHLFLLTL